MTAEDPTHQEKKEFDEHFDSKGRLALLHFRASTCWLCGALVVQTEDIVQTHMEWHENETKAQALAEEVTALKRELEHLKVSLARLSSFVSSPSPSEVKW